MKQIIFSRIVLALTILMLFTNDRGMAQSVVPTEIPVAYDVTSTGAFTYSVPLEMPPGIKSLLPNLAITYSSQSGNSNLGTGWTLTGISSITRAGTTIFHNQTLDPVNFNQSDVFMLDGQRLVETSPGTFMTEIKNFAIIQSHGTAGSGPSYFTVEYPNGLTYEYGNSDSSKMIANGRSDVLVWAVNKIYDKNGNYIDFDYFNNQQYGEYRIKDIHYGGNTNAATAAPNWIKFNYIVRSDFGRTWVGAIASNSPHVIDEYVVSSIEIKLSDSTTVNTYEFTYDPQSEYSHLTQIKEKRGLGNYLPPIKINWGNPGTDTVAQTTAITKSPLHIYFYSTGDYDGDGATDLGSVDQLGSNNAMDIYFSDKNYDFISQGNASLSFASSQARVFNMGAAAQGGRISLDYNGDGYDDIILLESTLPHAWEGHLKLHYFESNGSGFTYKGTIFQYDNNSWCGSACNYTSEYYLLWTRVIPGDFDGDGRKDMLMIIPSDLTGTTNDNEGQKFDAFIIGKAYPNGGYNPSLGSWGSIDHGDYRYVGKIEHELYGSVPLEYDGDGKTELLTVGNSDHAHDAEIWQLNPTYTVDSVISPGSLSVIYNDTFPSHRSRIKIPTGFAHGKEYKYNIWTGDFNGDGKDDILTYKSNGGFGALNNHWELAYSTGVTGTTGGGWQFITGTQFFPYTDLHFDGPWRTSEWAYQVADFNGDGKADILEMHDATGGHLPFNNSYKIFYSRGYDFAVDSGALSDSFSVCEYNQVLGDFNGDGQIDVLADIPHIPSPAIAYFRKNDLRNTVSSIEHAGRRLDVEIKTISSATPDTADEDHYGYNDWHIDDSVTIHTPREYPYTSRQLPLKVVTKLKDNISMYKSYYYQTLSYNFLGLGIQGFEKMRVRDFVSAKEIINHFSLFPWWGHKEGYSRVPFLYETTVAPIGNPSNTMLSKRYNYTDKPGDPSGKVRIIVNHNTIETNYATGAYTDNYIFYDFSSWHFQDFGQPEGALTDNGVQNGYKRDSVIYKYDANAVFCNKSKPISVRKTSTYPTRQTYTRATDFGYNTKGELVRQVIDPGTVHESTTDYFYDATFGNLDSTSLHASGLPSANKSYEYSSNGKYLVKENSFLGNIVYTDSFEYNKWGKATLHKKPTGLKTRYAYDSVNRLISEITPDDVTLLTTYNWAYNDPYGDNPNPVFSDYNIITQNQGAAQFVMFSGYEGWAYYDIIYNDFYSKTLRHVTPSFWSNHSSIYSDTKYYGDGKLMSFGAPYFKGNTTTRSTFVTYDEFDREKIISNTPGPDIVNTYNVSVLPSYLEKTTTNVATSQSKTTISNAGGAYQVNDNGTSISYLYNSNGQPDEITVNNDPDLKTIFTYDPFGRVKSKKEPNKGTIRYTYNAYDQVIEENDGHTVYTYTYDGLGRVLTKKDQSSKGFTFEFYNVPNLPSTGKIKNKITDYDSTGNIVSTYFEYNSVGKVEKMVEAVDASHSYTTKYLYGALGKLAVIEYPSGIAANYQYGPLGQLFRVYVDNHMIWECNDRNELNALTNATLFDQSGQALYKIERTYDPLGRPNERKLLLSNNNTPLSWQKYVFDQYTGNLTHRENIVHNLQEDFVYDGFDRLTDVSSNTAAPHLHLEYDAVGNILRKNDITTRAINWQYNKYALLTVPDEIAGAGGVQLSSVRQPQTQNIRYYPFNKAKEISEGTNKIRFTYNADQERVKAVFDPAIPASKERYYATNYEETYENGIVTKITYITVDGEPLAAVINKNGTANFYYMVTDHLGSITELLDDQGAVNNGVVEERSYDAWGRSRDPLTWQYFMPSTAPAWKFDRGYTGMEHIWISGNYDHSLVNLNGRLYDPLVGRMLSPDLVVADNTSTQAYNKYSYVLNNPLKYNDPTGNTPFLVLAVIYGACLNAASNGATIEKNPASLFGYLAVGAASSLAAEWLGPITHLKGFGLTIAGAFTGSFVTGAGNTFISGGSAGDIMYVGARGGAMSAIMAGISAGVTAGVSAIASDRVVDQSSDFILADREPEPRQTGQRVDKDDFGIYVQHTENLFKPQLTKGTPNVTLGTETADPKLAPVNDQTVWGYTVPTHGNWFTPDRANIVINEKSLKGDVLLMTVLHHEYTHAVQIADGTAKGLFVTFIGNPQAAMTFLEKKAYEATSIYVQSHLPSYNWIKTYRVFGGTIVK